MMQCEPSSLPMAERIELWPLERLRPYERNPRTHSEAQIARLAASIAEFGFTNPVLVDSSDGIVAGHGRLEAARLLGMERVPVVILDHLSDAQRRAYIIADNRLAMDAGWDEALLASELSALRAEDFDLALTGITGLELEDLFAWATATTDSDSPADDAPAPPATAVSRTGDLWLLGRHRVLCGDATCAADVERLMDGAAADCLWTDPPYNVDYEGEAGRIANDKMSADDFATFLRAAFAPAFAALKPGAAAYVAHADTEGLAFRRAFIEAGFKLSGCLIWRKNALVLGRSDYQWLHEPILYGWKPGAAHTWFGGRDKTTVIDAARPARSAEHPTMKPVALIEHMLTNSSATGDVVLDVFGGSGSTLIAAERSARVARVLELDPCFVDVIVRRWEQFTDHTAALEAGGQSFAEIARARSNGDGGNG